MEANEHVFKEAYLAAREVAEQSHAGDANVVSLDCDAGVAITFVERFEVTEGAPLMRGR